jgi:hypothetical protein
MGLFSKKVEEVETQAPLSEAYVDAISRYFGVVRLRQQAFSEVIVNSGDWDADLSAGTITFGGDVFPAQLLGSTSSISNTWLWGFANPSFAGRPCVAESEAAFAFCQAIGELALEQFPLHESLNEHHIASIVVGPRTDRTCYFSGPTGSGNALILVGDVPSLVFDPAPVPAILAAVSETISMMPLNHRTVGSTILAANCSKVEGTDDGIVGHHTSGLDIRLAYDEYDRMVSMSAG